MRYRRDVNDQVTEAEVQGIHRESARFDYDANLNLTLGRTRRAAFAAEGESVRMQRQEKGRVSASGRCRYRYNEQGQLSEKRELAAGFRPRVRKYRWNGQGDY